MDRRAFVIVPGLPGGGETTLARTLPDALSLPLIDNDRIPRPDVLHGISGGMGG